MTSEIGLSILSKGDIFGDEEIILGDKTRKFNCRCISDNGIVYTLANSALNFYLTSNNEFKSKFIDLV